MEEATQGMNPGEGVGCRVKVILGAGYQGMSPLQNFEQGDDAIGRDRYIDNYVHACVHMHRYVYIDIGICI